jgi:hypothetical protein
MTLSLIPDSITPGNGGVLLERRSQRSPAQPLPPVRMQAGEAMRLQVIPDTASPLNGGYPIDRAGFADLPWLGRFQVEGMTPSELEEALSDRLRDQLKGAAVHAFPAMRIGFLGNWARPGEHYVSMDASIWEAVLTTGGPLGGGLGVVQVMRGNDLMMQVNLNNDFAKQATLGGAGIRSGDVFLMPMAIAPAAKSTWDSFKEGLTVSTQVLAVLGSLLSTYLTYVVLSDRGKL